uniref:virulence associated lipoprotein n=2 Tax=Borreliella afzelii TaxID=29518 RepID=UPI003AF66EBD
SGESVTADTKRSKDYRKQTYATLNNININELKTFSEIVVLAKQTHILINIVRSFGAALDDVIVCLYPKKDILDKLEISDLQKLKNLLEKLLSTKADVSKMLNQLLLDYQNDTNSIQTDTAKLEPRVTTFSKQMLEKQKEAENIRNEIFTIQKNL